MNFQSIEKKWQKIWEKKGIYKVKDRVRGRRNFYHLIMFPYPSGDLHIGHWYNFAPADVFARFKKMTGYNVLSPIGFDAFGLPAENAAIKRGIHPKDWTYKNIKTMTVQLKSIGAMYDWSRHITTADPKYYKWTQWMFLKFFENGLAYKTKATANWCPKCHTVLANEQVVNGQCERCQTEVVQREIEQWLLKITDYAEKLLKGLENLDWPEKTKIMQKNWIGKSEGAIIEFKVKSLKFKVNEKIEVFTTRLDTIYGCTYLVIAPENELIEKIKSQIANWPEVLNYIEESKRKLERERLTEDKQKTGVELKGVKAINPFNQEEVPVYVADYVLGHYGTGAVMAVPAHDERDFEFTKKYNLPIKEVIIPNRIDKKNPPVSGKISKERKNVHALVRNPKNNKFLCLKSKKFLWVTFPMGGVEENEDVVEAAKREVEEETGYKNLKLVKILGGEVRAEYFAKHKDENRVAYTTGVLFDLIDEEKSPVDKEWEDSHEIMWISENDVNYDTLCHAELDVWLTRLKNHEQAYTEDGILINSGRFTKLESSEAREKMAEWLKKNNSGEKSVKYRLRDWIISRQRYWGAPIPLVYCENCADKLKIKKLKNYSKGEILNPGWIAVREKDLPVELPNVKNYLPTEEGKSPLAHSQKFVHAKCPKCGGPAKRETDTMDTFVCSSWYYLRYVDPKNNKKFAEAKKIKNWLPVDVYIGGAEHAVLHLLYVRFFTKVLNDLKYLNFKEPFLTLRHQGTILGTDGQKMSKSRGNVVDPDSLVRKFGSDTVKMHFCFMGPYEQGGPWNPGGILGVKRFLERVHNFSKKQVKKEAKKNIVLDKLLHSTIKKITENIGNFRFNTAVSSLMILFNEIERQPALSVKNWEIFLKLLAPLAPYLSEELWKNIGHKKSIHLENWPRYSSKLAKIKNFELIIQINGKFRDKILVESGISQEHSEKEAFASEKIKNFIGDKEVKKIIFVPDKLINIVI
ncbi:MAG: class I tRNA ligase family protein [Patescibacteria group bacterium]